MIEILGGALVMLGGVSLSAGSYHLARTTRQAQVANELVRALPFTPVPGGTELDALFAQVASLD